MWLVSLCIRHYLFLSTPKCTHPKYVALKPTVECVFAELQEASEDTQTRFKAEKQSRKQLDMKITALEEELTDLRVEKETLERVRLVLALQRSAGFQLFLKLNPPFL